MMSKKSCTCAICENSNLPSFCIECVNFRGIYFYIFDLCYSLSFFMILHCNYSIRIFCRLSESYTCLKSLHRRRSSLYSKLEEALEAKRKMEEQLSWRRLQKERLKRLKDRLHNMQMQLSKERAVVAEESNDLMSKFECVESAFSKLKERREYIERNFHSLKCTHEFRLMAISSELLHKQAVVLKQICKLFPVRRKSWDGEQKDGLSGPYDTICDARLPRGLDPLSVPPDELAASLGYMIQFLNLVIPCLASPTLHASGFAGSCSLIWQRESYREARPSSQSKEYPLSFPRQNFGSSTVEASWSERNSSSFGVRSVESEKKSSLDSAPSSSFNVYSAFSRSVASQRDLQKGISLLKKSVACITAYCNNLYCLDTSPEGSTFEAFAKILSILSSSKEMKAVISSRMVKPKSDNQLQALNKSIWNANSTSISSLIESAHSLMIVGNAQNLLSSPAASFLYPELADSRKSENLVDGWDLIEHPILPPPSQPEDVEHWTRAMFIDASSK